MKFYAIFVVVLLVKTVLTTTTNPTTTVKPTTKTTAPTTTPTTVTTTPTTTPTTVTTAPTTKPTTVTTAPTTGAPTTTPTPPPAEPQTGQWSVVDGGVRCILIDMAARIEVTGASKKSLQVNLASNASATGSCKNPQNIEWAVNDDWNLQYTFEQTNKDSFDLKNVSLTNMKEKKSAMRTLDGSAGASTANSYRCNSSSIITMLGDSFNVTLNVTNMLFQAYRTKNDTVFDEAVPCPADKTPASNIVPIAVGAALAGLVVIVLIAYLIGRRQNRQGYESV